MEFLPIIVIDMAPPKIPPKVKDDPRVRFYNFPSEDDKHPEGIPPSGLYFDEVGLKDQFVTGADDDKTVLKTKLPATAEFINTRLTQMFAGRGHRVRIEAIGDKFYYILRFGKEKGEAGRFPVILSEFNEKNQPSERNGFLVFNIGKKEAGVEERGESYRAVVLKESDSQLIGNSRYLVVPVNLHEGRLVPVVRHKGRLNDKGEFAFYINREEIVGADLGRILFGLSGDKGVRTSALMHLKNGHRDETGLYLADVWQVGDMLDGPSGQKVPPLADPVVEKPIPKVLPGDRDDLAKRIVTTVIGNRRGFGKAPESADVVFSLDTSGSMEFAAANLMRNIGKIARDLKESGVKRFRVGIVRFGFAESILMPLTEMDADGIEKMLKNLAGLKFDGGYEPVGEATMLAVGMLEKSDAMSKAVFVITDDDGLREDKFARPYLEDAVQAGSRASISVELLPTRIEAMSVSLEIVADTEKLVIENNVTQLRELASKSKVAYVRIETARALAGMGYKEGLGIMRELAFESNDDYVNVEAASALAGVGEQIGIDILSEFATRSRRDGVRLKAACSLAGLGKKKGIKVLHDLVLNSSVDEVRFKADIVLCGFGEEAREVFLDLALRSNDEDVRLFTARALAELGDVAGIKILLNLAIESDNGPIRSDAHDVLSLMKEKINPILFDLALNSNDGRVRYNAALEIERLGDKRGKQILILELLKSHDYERLKVYAEAWAGLRESVDGYRPSYKVAEYVLDKFKDYRLAAPAIVIITTLGLVAAEDDKEIKRVTDRVADIADKTGDPKFTLYSMAAFSIYVRDIDKIEREYLPIVRDVRDKAVDPAYDRFPRVPVRYNVIDHLAVYLDMGHSVAEIVRYKDTLLKNLDSMTVTVAGIEYRLMDHLIINSKGIHYYTNMGRAVGRQELAELVFIAKTEESWLYVVYEKDGQRYERFFENGEMEEAGKSGVSGRALSSLLNDRSVRILSISDYHIHPLGGVDESLKDGSHVLLLSSPNDLKATLETARYLRSAGYTGQYDSRAVTPVGEYILTPSDSAGAERSADDIAGVYQTWLEGNKNVAFEADVVEGLNATGAVKAEYVYHNATMKDVQRLYKELIEINRLANANGGKMRDMEEARNLWSRLDTHYRAFSSAVSMAKAGGVPAILLKPYEKALEDEFSYLSALSKIFDKK